MAIDVGDAVLKITGDTGGLDKSLDSVQKKAGGLGSTMKGIGIGLAAVGTAAIGAGVASVKSFADAGDEVQKMALRTGMSTEALSELRYMADLSGTSLGGLEAGFKKMQRTIIDAQDGTETYTEAFDRINVNYKELMGLSPEEQFNKITTALAAVEDPTLKAAAAQEIFGRSGTDLLPMLAQGSEGIAKMKQEAREMGVVFSQEDADAAADLKDGLTRVEGAAKGLMNEIAKALLPALMPLIDAFKELILALPIQEIAKLISGLLPPLVNLMLRLLKAIPVDVLIQFVNAALSPMLEILIALLPVLEPILYLFGRLLSVLTPVLNVLGSVLSFIAKILGSGITTVLSGIASIFGGKATSFNIPSFQGFEGIVPGIPGTPIPAIVHAGEYIGQGGGNTVNIYNPVVRSDNDITEITKQVSREMYRMQQSRLLQYGT